MAHYVVLGNWTEQGVRDYRATVDRSERAGEWLASMGGRLASIYWTLGPHDFVATLESPDDETTETFLLWLGSQGNVTTSTLRGFDATEMRAIIARASQ